MFLQKCPQNPHFTASRPHTLRPERKHWNFFAEPWHHAQGSIPFQTLGRQNPPSCFKHKQKLSLEGNSKKSAFFAVKSFKAGRALVWTFSFNVFESCDFIWLHSSFPSVGRASFPQKKKRLSCLYSSKIHRSDPETNNKGTNLPQNPSPKSPKSYFIDFTVLLKKATRKVPNFFIIKLRPTKKKKTSTKIKY